MEKHTTIAKMNAVLLSKSQSTQARGEANPNNFLEPTQINDEQFFVLAEVLDEPIYAKFIPFLRTLPRCVVLQKTTNGSSPEYPKVVYEVVEGSVHQPSYPPRIYVPKGNAYDRPPFPEKGEWSESAIFESVGRALTAWEKFESSFMRLFQAFLSPSFYHAPVWRAYGSVTTFRGRADMVAAAAEAFFMESADEIEGDQQKRKFEALIKVARKFSERRNDIAHGLVAEYISPSGRPVGLALMPPTYSTNKQNLKAASANGDHSAIPVYGYTSVEINYFANEFSKLVAPTIELETALFRYFDFEPYSTQENHDR